MDVPALGTGKMMGQVCLVHGGLLAHLQHEMAHVFVDFTELCDSVCVSPLVQLWR